jgi:hypothetical protein
MKRACKAHQLGHPARRDAAGRDDRLEGGSGMAGDRMNDA